jgi:hypothetical protein
MLTRAEIRNALLALAGELTPGDRCEVIIVGGAALVLLYGARESTKDVDAVLLTEGDGARLRQAALRVANAAGLPDDWFNDAAKGYVHGLALGEVLLDEPALRIRALEPHQLLAMKLAAWRDDVDIADARLLLGKLPPDRDRAWALVEPYLIPGRETKAWYAFCDLWEAEHAAP